MIQGFDFGFSPEGELIIDAESHDIKTAKEDELRIQLAYNRIKSVSTNWYIDKIGADLEEIIGRTCDEDTAEYGKTKIMHALTFDRLWEKDDVFIKAEIKNNVNITYSIYLKVVQKETEDVYSYEIEAELDLVKGVKIRYGWEPRR